MPYPYYNRDEPRRRVWRSAPISQRSSRSITRFRPTSCPSRSTSAPAWWRWNVLFFSAAHSSPVARKIGGMEPRRLSGRRAGPLRRVPHAEELAGRRRDQPCAAGRRAAGLVRAGPDGRCAHRPWQLVGRRGRRLSQDRPERDLRGDRADGGGDRQFDLADDRCRSAGDRHLSQGAAGPGGKLPAAGRGRGPA